MIATNALRLFGARVTAQHAAKDITESSPERLRLARTTGRTVLADYDDEPTILGESAEGTVVQGRTHLMFLSRDGDVVVKESAMQSEERADESVGALSKWQAKKHSSGTSYSHPTQHGAYHIAPSSKSGKTRHHLSFKSKTGAVYQISHHGSADAAAKAARSHHSVATSSLHVGERVEKTYQRTKANEAQDQKAMTTQLREEDYAEIVVGDDGLVLLVNGEQTATEDCDLSDEADCERAEAALTRQAEALGYVEEGTFDASYEKGGKVVNGDEQDDWQDGEGYYARRYRRRTSNAETGKPMMPALEHRVRVTLAAGQPELLIAETIVCARDSATDQEAFAMGAYDVASKSLVVGFQTEAEATAFVESLDASVGVAEKFTPFKKKGKGKPTDDEDEPDGDEEDGEEPDDDTDEALIDLATQFLSERVKLDEHGNLIQRFDNFVLEGDYERALDEVEAFVGHGQMLDEYKRRMGAALSNFRRSLKTQTSAEKLRNRNRRKAWRSNPSLRRKAAKYRVKVKRFMRKHESVDEGDAGFEMDGTVSYGKKTIRLYCKGSQWKFGYDGTMGNTKYKSKNAAIAAARSMIDAGSSAVDDGADEATNEVEDTSIKSSVSGTAAADMTLIQVCAGEFSDLKGEYTTFDGLKERIQAAYETEVSDPELMRAVSQLVGYGFTRFVPGRGYTTEEVDPESAARLARAARIAGNKYVVTIAGSGSPIFLPTLEDATGLWKSLPTRLRGMKATLTSYLQSIGVGDEGSGEPA